MTTREPDAKRRRLLTAALAEFSARGTAATPVDVVARRAECSPGLIYRYFGSKEGLADAVYDDIAAMAVETVSLDAGDLVGYAVALHDASEARPDVNRFLAWRELDREPGAEPSPGPQGFFLDKVAEVEQAQDAGTLRADLPAANIAMVVQTLARMWSSSPLDVRTVADPEGAASVRRDAVRSAVAAFLTGPIEAGPVSRRQ